MRQKGRLTEWRDERGFGFVTPLAGGERAFVHISAFTGGRRRPVGGELLTYEATRDSRGRWQARNVALSADRGRRATGRGGVAGTLFIAGGFLAALAGAAVAGPVPAVVPAAYLAASVVAYVAYAIDKAAARSGRWRTHERTLLLLGLLGGWPGALVAQRVLRHKSRKRPFRAAFLVTAVVNVGVLLWWLLAGEAP